jgi:hypothetical protein
MTQTDLLQLKRDVRRDHSLTENARLLFAEIADLHLMQEGCFAYDTTLAGWIGTSQRTVERRRKELTKAGYLRVEKRGGERHLIPQRPTRSGDDSPDDTDDDTRDVSADDMGASDDSGDAEAPDTRDVHREIDIPADAGEGARPRGDDSSDGHDSALSIHQEWYPDVSLSIGQKEILKQIEDLAVWSDVVEWWCGNGYKGRSISRMKQRYEEVKAERHSSQLTPEQQQDPDYTVNEDGEVCYKGVPLSQIGPQNLAADLQGDGHAGADPEVSAHE